MNEKKIRKCINAKDTSDNLTYIILDIKIKCIKFNTWALHVEYVFFFYLLRYCQLPIIKTVKMELCD